MTNFIFMNMPSKLFCAKPYDRIGVPFWPSFPAQEAL